MHTAQMMPILLAKLSASFSPPNLIYAFFFPPKVLRTYKVYILYITLTFLTLTS